MKRAALVGLLLLAACRKQEQLAPAPETKPSAATEPLQPVEAMACRDGTFGAPRPAASAPPPPPIGEDASLFGPWDGGAGGLGLSGVGGFGAPIGIGFGHGIGARPTMMRHPFSGAPDAPGGAGIAAIAKGVCAAHRAIKRCHDEAKNPTGTMTFAITVNNGSGANAKQTGGALTDATLATCVGAALVAQGYDASANGTTSYTLTFEPARRMEPARVTEGAPTITGTLPPEVIRRILRRETPKLLACHHAALAANPALGGTMKMKLVIDPTGAVTSVSVEDGTITDLSMRSCVTSALKSASFPRPESGIVVVTHPLTFTAPN